MVGLNHRAQMTIVRVSKSILVATVALWVSLVAFGNITDYGTNLAFVNHVLSMDTLYPGTTIRYRAITSPAMHQAAYLLIITAEVLAAILCWIGAIRMIRAIPAPAAFARSKDVAVTGLTMCLVIWLVGFMAIGGEWFGMWMSTQWNGIESAFRFSALILGILMFVTLPDGDPTG
jgi:predicted small integral membrane protein